jgi:hydroxymethylpyrimidine pyrophosphatase-like HAD family hydrolase
MLQAIDGHLPAIFEDGCGLYLPQGYRFLAHPALKGGTEFADVRERLRAALVQTGRVFFQPGKEFSLSLFPLDGVTVDDLLPLATEALGPAATSVNLVYSFSCLNVVPRGLDKGAGLAFLCQQSGYAADEVLAVGDSDVDLPLLAAAGYAAAPANANAGIKALAHYVSPLPTTQGVRDILHHYAIPI